MEECHSYECTLLFLIFSVAAKLGDAHAPTELAEFFDKQREMSLEHRKNQRDAMEFLHKYRDDGQRVLGEIRRTASKDSECSIRRGAELLIPTLSDTLGEVTEAELAQQRLQLFQQSTERVKSFENLHAYRVQNALVECSSGESGAPIPKKVDYRLATLSIDSPTTIPEVDHTKNEPESQKEDATLQNSQIEERIVEGEAMVSADRPAIETGSIDGNVEKLQIPSAHEEIESKKRLEENAPRLHPSVEDLVSTFLMTGQRSNSLEADTPIDSKMMLTESTKNSHDMADYDKPFIGCQFGCLEIRLNLDHAYVGVQNLTNVLSSPKNSKDALEVDTTSSLKSTDKLNLAVRTEAVTTSEAEIPREAEAMSQSCGDVANEKSSSKSMINSILCTPLAKTTNAAKEDDEKTTPVPTDSSPSAKTTNAAKEDDEKTTPVPTDSSPLAKTTNAAKEDDEKTTPVPKDSSPQQLPVKQTEHKSSSRKVERVSRIVAPKVKSPVNSKKVSRSPRTPRIPHTLRTPKETTEPSAIRTIMDSPRRQENPSPKNVVLTNVPLYMRSVARQKPERGPTCSLKYVPKLHKSVAACERCLYWASAEEKQKFEATGYQLRIMKCRGGCDRDCVVFPRMKNEFPVRLCKKCFFDTHLNPKKRDDDESCSVFSKSTVFSK
jgi:hypothetical protein